MLRVGWVTCEKMKPYSQREAPVVQHLQKLGHEVVSIVWNRRDVDIQALDKIIIRSPWDYYFHVEEFRAWIQSLPNGKVYNSKRVLLWNIDKIYLKELAEKGIEIVPTRFYNVEAHTDLSVEVSHVSSTEVVIKPSQSASSHLTQIVKQGERVDSTPYLGKCVLIQPKLNEVLTEGEYSQIYFGGKYSHTVLKKPKSGDFRVQQSFGGSVERVHPDAKELKFGERVVACIPEPTLYARVDYVRLQGRPHLMELEVLEPDLFFDQDPESVSRFVSLI